MFYDLFCSPVSVYTGVWFFSVFCILLGYFTPNLTINECRLTPHGYLQIIVPIEVRKNTRISRWSSPGTVRGEIISASLFIFLYRVAEVDQVFL